MEGWAKATPLNINIIDLGWLNRLELGLELELFINKNLLFIEKVHYEHQYSFWALSLTIATYILP